jgi:gamma-glutamylcyclotransferase (GGCT)/AIG2-like uncharacterized protein YtfP
MQSDRKPSDRKPSDRKPLDCKPSDRKPSIMVRKFLEYDSQSARGDRSTFVYRPLSDKPQPFKKVFYFFYGTLMDSDTLSKVLGTERRPETQPAKIFRGFTCKLWGPYPALINAERPWEPIHGVVYEVQNEDEEQRLLDYHGVHYSLTICKVELEDGSTNWVHTFEWQGDESRLKEGKFDLDAWKKKQQRGC